MKHTAGRAAWLWRGPSPANETEIEREQGGDGEEKPVGLDQIHAEAGDRRAAEHAKRVEHDEGGIGASQVRPAVARAKVC